MSVHKENCAQGMSGKMRGAGGVRTQAGEVREATSLKKIHVFWALQILSILFKTGMSSILMDILTTTMIKHCQRHNGSRLLSL